MRAGSVASHEVDLRDHLGYALNNLRFGERVWESNYFKSSGYYTNRILHADMLKMFYAAGFVVDKIEVSRWDKLPTSREKLSLPFCHMLEAELSISSFNICIRI